MSNGRRRLDDPVRRAERHARAVCEARSLRRVASSVARIESLDEIVRHVAIAAPESLAAVEASYVRAVAAISEKAAAKGFAPNRPRELFAAWIAEAVGAQSLSGLRTFLDEFWSGPNVPYAQVRAELPRVQHLRRLHELASGTAVWRSDPSWPDSTARAALELAADRWEEHRATR